MGIENMNKVLWFIYLYCVYVFLRQGFPAGELAVWPRLTFCLCLSSAGITGMHHHL
jgi:uncharacterized protein (DUF3820 family)